MLWYVYNNALLIFVYFFFLSNTMPVFIPRKISIKFYMRKYFLSKRQLYHLKSNNKQLVYVDLENVQY